MQERPNINNALSSLKSAMFADKDQVLEEDYGQNINVELENTVSDEAVEMAIEDTVCFDSDEAVEVYCSNEEDVEIKKQGVSPVKADEKVFVLSKMIQEDGSVINLQVEQPRPSIGISEEKIEGIVREEAKSLLKEWIENNMYNILKHRKVER